MPITKLQKPFKYFSILRPMKNDVRFEYAHGKMSDFISFPLFRFTLVIKFKKNGFKSHWNTLIFFHKKVMASDLNMSHWKMSGLF